jgi:hypothetical protein
MDFHTMVSTFKRQVLKEEEELEELSRGARERVKKYIKDGTPGRHTPQYSFDHLFGDNETMRVIVPLQANIRIGGTKLFKRIVDQGWTPNFTTRTIKQKKQRLAADGGGEYEEEFDAPVLTMGKSEQRTIPAGPRKGEVITSVKKMSLGKLVQRLGTEEDKAWWAENQSDVQTGADAVENMQNYFLKPWMNEFKGIGSNRPIIVISRYPMDVARMSDFSMTHSCHSEDGGYFNCALHESKGHGLVAFLIKPEDVEEITQRIERGDEEIFGDNNINDLQGLPEPIARVRLYKLYNPYTEEEFAVPEERVYGMNIPDFLPTVRAWARENQKDIWSGDTDGEKLDRSALDPTAWTRVGGSYSDAEQSGTGLGGLIAAMFERTKFSEEAEEFEEREYEYEDLYDEDNEEESEMQEAEDRLEATLDTARNNSDNIDFYGQIEEGWDGMPWYLQGGCGFQLAIPLTEEESEKIPEGSYSATRGFVEDLTSVMENYEPWSEYDGWELEYDTSPIKAIDGGFEYELQIRVRGDFRAEQGGMEQVSDFDYWVREVIENMDEKMESMKGAIRAKLIELGIKSRGAYEDAVDEMVEEMEYENFTILYDEDDPADGIDIVLHTSKTEKMELMRDRPSGPARYFKVITTVPAFDANGNPAADRFKYLLDRDSDPLMAKVRRNFKRILRKAQQAANKQISLPLGDKFKTSPKPIVVPDKDLKVFIAASRSPFRTAGGRHPIQTQYMSDEQQDAQSKKPMEVGYRFQFKIGQEITSDEYEEIKVFLDYLDNNLESFEDSIVDEVNKLYQDAAEQVAHNVSQGRKYGTSDQQSRLDKMTRAVQPAADAAPDQIAEANIRAAIRKVIRKHLLREQEEKFQTRMFQISLRLQITKGAGGGIEQKLNRIRAIDGVTVVGHDEGEKVGGLRVIEARVKFHPESDSLRPMSYVQQILVPDINSSRVVPGVKVIEIVSGTLKRLDK